LDDIPSEAAAIAIDKAHLIARSEKLIEPAQAAYPVRGEKPLRFAEIS